MTQKQTFVTHKQTVVTHKQTYFACDAESDKIFFAPIWFEIVLLSPLLHKLSLHTLGGSIGQWEVGQKNEQTDKHTHFCKF